MPAFKRLRQGGCDLATSERHMLFHATHEAAPRGVVKVEESAEMHWIWEKIVRGAELFEQRRLR